MILGSLLLYLRKTIRRASVPSCKILCYCKLYTSYKLYTAISTNLADFHEFIPDIYRRFSGDSRQPGDKFRPTRTQDVCKPVSSSKVSNRALNASGGYTSARQTVTCRLAKKLQKRTHVADHTSRNDSYLRPAFAIGQAV